MKPLIGIWQLVMLVALLLWPVHNMVLALLGEYRRRSRWPPAADNASCLFWLVIPALNEERVIANTVRAALELDSSRTPVRVVVVDDASDDGTAVVLDAFSDPRLYVLRRELPHARQGKGEALNAAYRMIRAEAAREGTVARTVFGVIDGDGRAAPGCLAEVASFLAEPGVGAVQTRVRIHNRTRLLGLLQDIEFACVAGASQVLRDLDGSVGLGGNGQFVQLAALLQFGDAPWSRCLVEDLELGLRLHLAGAKIRYTRRATITQQAVTDPARLFRQRTRWALGNLQCLPHVWKLVASRRVGSIGLLDFLQYLITPWLTVPVSVVVIGILATSISGILGGYSIPVLVAAGQSLWRALALWLAMAVIPGLLWGTIHRLSVGDEPYWRGLLAGLIYPGFLLLGVAATWYALYRYLTGQDQWDKTDRVVERPVLVPSVNEDQGGYRVG